MDIKLAKLGQTYRFYTSNGILVTDRVTNTTIKGTIIAARKDGSGFLLGWQPSEAHPTNGAPRTGQGGSPGFDYHPIQSKCTWGLNVNSTGIMHSKIPVPGEPDGCACKKCLNFYHMAEPNQPDGTLLCYSCRNRW
jgi:hypothetical protein